MEVKFVKLSENAIVPCYGREGDAGLDLYTAEEIKIPANETVCIPTNIAIQLPLGYEATVRPRSGHSLNGVKGCFKIEKDLTYETVKNVDGTEGKLLTWKEKVTECRPYLRVQLGTIDSNYRGDIGIITYNQEGNTVIVPKGTKLAQLVISPVMSVKLVEANELNNTNRGDKGFGSSDNK